MFIFYKYLSNEKPNVVIILTDDLGWGDVSYNGGPIPTPNIDKLANDGLRMNRFYSAPTCSPTRAALFTGLNSLTNGIIRPINNQPQRDMLSLEQKLCLNILKRWVIKLHYQENGILECTKMNTCQEIEV